MAQTRTSRKGITLGRLLLVLILIAGGAYLGVRLLRHHPGPEMPDAPALQMFCAAGVQPAVDAIVADYLKECGTHVGVQYGGSGQLLNAIAVARHGDLFLAADESYLRMARSKGLVAETIPLATMRPVIVVPKGNPKGIHSVDDLLRTDVRVALANPDQAAIGKLLREALGKTGQWDALAKRAAVLKPTVNDLATDVRVGSADAAIIWGAIVSQYPELEAVHAAPLDDVVENVTVAVLTSCADHTAALRFARYLAASDRGLQTFAKYGYQPVEGDEWARMPQITLYCGALNRVAVKDAIASFEHREGCRVNTVYNGCGILVSQMKAGQSPDAYLACDVSFVPPVADLFHEARPISEVPIVIVVAKGNPLGIRKLEDLTRANLRVGLCHSEQSSIGSLTKQLMDKMGIYDKVRPNVRTETPTADTLVNQLLLKTLDAIVVSNANASQVRDKLDVIEIPGATALQPFAIGKATKNPRLAGRLLAALTSDESRKHYESVGFQWRWQPTTQPATQPSEK